MINHKFRILAKTEIKNDLIINVLRENVYKYTLLYTSPYTYMK